MAREAKKIAAQAQANTQFDTVVEPFYRGPRAPRKSNTVSKPLSVTLLAVFLLALLALRSKRR